MQLYGYKSAHSVSLKCRRGGICFCCCCCADERHARSFRRRNRKRSRRNGKHEIKNQIDNVVHDLNVKRD